MANSADPDQLASDLDLPCLQRQDISGFSRTRIKSYFHKETKKIQCYMLEFKFIGLKLTFKALDTQQQAKLKKTSLLIINCVVKDLILTWLYANMVA